MRFFVFILVLVFTLSELPAQSALRSVRAAQALLGPSTWSRVVRVENHNPRSPYPRTEYALIFEFAGLLWFYSENDGTQSFSRFQNRLAQEKADFGPGLRAIEAGFSSYSILGDDSALPSPQAHVPNGCLIESIVAARERFRRGEQITAAKLVMFYAAQRREGHCVLAYETAEGIFTVDTGVSNRPRFVRRQWPATPVELARAVWPEGRSIAISQVRTLSCPLTPAFGADAPAMAASPARAGVPDDFNLADPGRG